MTYPAPIEKMIATVEKKKELSHAQAVEYMLTVATGRLSALWKYDATLPEGKTSKGVLERKGKKAPAERTASVASVIAAKEAKEAKAKKPRKPKAEKSSEPTA